LRHVPATAYTLVMSGMIRRFDFIELQIKFKDKTVELALPF
jgi:hypothetical protein